MSKDYELGILNYAPNFLDNTTDFLKQNSETLKSFEGHIVKAIYIVWSLEFDEVNFDSPAIIQTDQGQIVVSAKYFEHFSLTTELIDMDNPINWFSDTKFEWRCFKSYEDKNFKIMSSKIVEFKNKLNDHEFWALGGLYFSGDEEVIIVGNGLDCLFFQFSHEMEHTRFIAV